MIWEWFQDNLKMDVKKSDIWPKENLPYGHQKICHGVRKFAMDVRKSFMGFIDYTWTSKNLPWTLKIIHGRQKSVFEDDLKTIWVWFKHYLSMIWPWFENYFRMIWDIFIMILELFNKDLSMIWEWFQDNLRMEVKKWAI